MGMAKRISKSQREEVLDLLSQGHDRETIAARVGVTPAQVSAINAHVTIGTYELSSRASNKESIRQSRERVDAILEEARNLDGADAHVRSRADWS